MPVARFRRFGCRAAAGGQHTGTTAPAARRQFGVQGSVAGDIHAWALGPSLAGRVARIGMGCAVAGAGRRRRSCQGPGESAPQAFWHHRAERSGARDSRGSATGLGVAVAVVAGRLLMNNGKCAMAFRGHRQRLPTAGDAHEGCLQFLGRFRDSRSC
eukprot:8566724-Alexandrium_andersonii.AAC.1